MKHIEAMRRTFLASGLSALTLGLIFAVYLGTYHLGLQTQLAAAAKMVSQKGDCVLGDLKFSASDSIGAEQECKRGAEYEIIPPAPGKLIYDIKTTKCPPPPPCAAEWCKRRPMESSMGNKTTGRNC